MLGRLAAAEQRLSEAEQSSLEQAAAARRLEVEKEELAERLAAAQLEVAGLEAQVEVARLELEEKVLKLGTKIQVRQYPNWMSQYCTVYCHKSIFYVKHIPRQISQPFNYHVLYSTGTRHLLTWFTACRNCTRCLSTVFFFPRSVPYS